MINGKGEGIKGWGEVECCCIYKNSTININAEQGVEKYLQSSDM